MQRSLAPLPGDRAWQLLPIASDQNWGAASTQLVQALMDDHPLAIVAPSIATPRTWLSCGLEGLCAGAGHQR